MNPERLMNNVLRAHPRGYDLAAIMTAALTAADARAAVRRALRRTDDALFIGGRRFELTSGGRVFVVGAGKAGAPMTEAAVEILGDLIRDGMVVVKDGHLSDSSARVGAVEIFEASHPIPDQRGTTAARRLSELLTATTGDDLVLALISGGGSALLTLPTTDLSLSDVQVLNELLLRCGANIGEINALRKHCTQLGGGGLAQLAAPAKMAALIISDVVGSRLDAIASGMTAPDPTTFADAWRVVERYALQKHLPAAVVARLQRGISGALPETLKPDDARWQQVSNFIIAGNRCAAEAAVSAATERGFKAQLLTGFLEGEAAEVGRMAAAIGREMSLNMLASDAPQLFVLGGETTVTLSGDGQGGRNQELALGAVESLAGVPNVMLATLATDGGDGTTDAAGAVVTGETCAQAQALGFEAHDFLRRNDAYNFFAPLGALLKSGATLTNVNDLLFIIAAK